MLNDPLFNALRECFQQEPGIGNEGEQAVFHCPPSGRSNLKKAITRFAVVERWGECYTLNCPFCGDTRRRLWFSHLYGTVYRKGKTCYHFGPVYSCYNEHCRLSKQHEDRLEALKAKGIETVSKPSAGTTVIQIERDLPKGCLSLLSPAIPETVLTYLADRRFDLADLANNYLVRFAPAGTVYDETPRPDGSERVFYEDRLVIPIIQGRKQIGYQARRISEVSGNKGSKYLTLWAKTASSLYNRDKAMFHRDVVLVEGVTDVWRVGSQAVGLFGKTLKSGQEKLLALLWGFSGSCVVLLDRDDATAAAYQKRIVYALRKNRIFPRGVAEGELPAGKDPADLSTSEVLAIIEEARKGCR
jgi:hypothetical protein